MIPQVEKRAPRGCFLGGCMFFNGVFCTLNIKRDPCCVYPCNYHMTQEEFKELIDSGRV
jgi:hypothetical protein